MRLHATVAQLVEQLIRNQQVAGSSPASSSIAEAKRSFERRQLYLPSFLFYACRASFAQKLRFCARLLNLFMRAARKQTSPMQTPAYAYARFCSFASYWSFLRAGTRKTLIVGKILNPCRI